MIFPKVIKKKNEPLFTKDNIKDLDLKINGYRMEVLGIVKSECSTDIFDVEYMLKEGIITEEDIWDKKIIDFKNKINSLKDPISKEELMNIIGMTNEEFNKIIDSYRSCKVRSYLDDFTIYFVKTLLDKGILTEEDI